MKTLTLLLALSLSPLSNFAQWADTTSSARIDHINLQLDKSHKQFKTGTFLVIVGLAFNGAAVLAGSDNEGRGFIAGLGSLLVLSGGIVQIDSHKYIGRTRLND